MKATIWHNPSCGTSRKTLEILRATDGVETRVIEYLKTPYTRAMLEQLFADAGVTPTEVLRRRGTDADERGLAAACDDAILDAMTANPGYVDRPFVETEKGVRLCRPQDRVLEFL